MTISIPVIDALRNGAAVLGVVSDAGNCLMDAIRNQPDVEDAVKDMLKAVSTYPLYLELGTGAWEAERLPWESLHDTAKQFLAVHNSYWPVARRVEYWKTSAVPRSPRGPGGQLLLKILAVIAPAPQNAHDRSAFDEWDALEKVIQHINGKPAPEIEVEFQVLVADTAVETHINNKKLANVTVQPLTKKAKITDELRNYEPQVVHVFGHGVASGGGHIELADTHDIGLGNTVGSISLDANDLTSKASNSKIPIWAVVLNCCQTSANPGTSASFAHDLITEWIPVSVGVGESIDAADSHVVAGTLYSDLIDLSETELPPARGSPTLWSGPRSSGTAGVRCGSAPRGPVELRRREDRQGVDPALLVCLPRRLLARTPHPQHGRSNPGPGDRPDHRGPAGYPACLGRSSTISVTKRTSYSRGFLMAEPSPSDPSGPPSDNARAENAEFTLNAWRGGNAPVTGRFAAHLLRYATRRCCPRRLHGWWRGSRTSRSGTVRTGRVGPWCSATIS